MEAVGQSQTGEGQFARAHAAGVDAVLTRPVLFAAALALAVGLALRISMLHWAFQVNGDSLLYGALAKNLLLHGRYAIDSNDVLHSTLIRLPGYPLFLALCFRLFGMENYWAAACVQIVLELAGCILLADFARLASSAVPGADVAFARRAAMATLCLAALCPFTASYAATPMAEAPTLFVLALAMQSMARFHANPRWLTALVFTFAVTAATLLRPDGALAAIAFAPVMLSAAIRDQGSGDVRQGNSDQGRGSSEQKTLRAPSFSRLFAKRMGNDEPDAASGLKGPGFTRAGETPNSGRALAPEGKPLNPRTAENGSPPHRNPARACRIATEGAGAFRPLKFVRRATGLQARNFLEGFGLEPVDLARKKDRALAPGGRRTHFRMALVCALLALAPFAAWTLRNWRVFHVFQPLAPRLATDPGESSNPGWERWVKTWCLDFVSTYDIYWEVPDDRLDISKLPNRAFDSPAQYAQTAALVREYNNTGQDLTPAIDAAFGRLADARIAAHPFRYYVLLPLGRVADMWLRPRVENLNIDLDWWVYSHHRSETLFSWFYAALNALYLLLAAIGVFLRPRYWKPLLGYMLLRSAMLLTVEAPEARYTLECFPMLFVLGGTAVAAARRRTSTELTTDD